LAGHVLAPCKFLLLIFRPMKLGRTWIVCFCVSALALTTFAQEQDAVRPTGIPESLAKESPQISPPRATRARSRHRHAKTKAQSNEERDEVSPPRVSGGAPATGARSVMMVDACAEVMNQRARELGATHSHFVNPNGLPVPDQYSSARDLSIIARVAYANPTIRSIVCLPQLVFRYANGRTRELENTNKVLRRSPYCNGMKTGYTEAAGHCLICSGSRPGRDIIVVVLGDSTAVWPDASALLSWGP